MQLQSIYFAILVKRTRHLSGKAWGAQVAPGVVMRIGLNILCLLSSLWLAQTSSGQALRPSEAVLDAMADLGRMSPKGVVAGFGQTNGVRYPILVFINESSFDGLREKLQKHYGHKARVNLHLTSQSKSLLITPLQCPTCKARKNSFNDIVQNSLHLSWIETPDIRFAITTPFAATAAMLELIDNGVRAFVQTIDASLELRHSQSWQFSNTSIQTYIAESSLPLAELQARTVAKYENLGWKLQQHQDLIVGERKGMQLHLRFSITPQRQTRLSSYAINVN